MCESITNHLSHDITNFPQFGYLGQCLYVTSASVERSFSKMKMVEKLDSEADYHIVGFCSVHKSA